MPGTNENPEPRLTYGATDQQISDLFDSQRESHMPASDAFEAALRAVFMAGYNAGVTAVAADLPKPEEPKGSTLFTGRATGWDEEGYYHPNWSDGVPVEVRADTRDEAFEKAYAFLGPHPRFGRAARPGHRGSWPGWTINWTTVRVVS